MLRPEEYVQMAGRAGRRGLDDVGTVLVVAHQVRPAPPAHACGTCMPHSALCSSSHTRCAPHPLHMHAAHACRTLLRAHGRQGVGCWGFCMHAPCGGGWCRWWLAPPCVAGGQAHVLHACAVCGRRPGAAMHGVQESCLREQPCLLQDKEFPSKDDLTKLMLGKSGKLQSKFRLEYRCAPPLPVRALPLPVRGTGARRLCVCALSAPEATLGTSAPPRPSTL